MANPVEVWKSEKHGLDVWLDVERYAAARTPMKEIDSADLERMKWHGFFYRKRDVAGRYMSRIRVTAGELSADAAREIAHIAYEYGHGIVDVTTRANVQVQGLGIEHLPRVAARLESVGLTARQTGHDNVRNVFAHPFSGLLPGELYDTRQLCRDVTTLFVGNREYADLPRKFNICLNGHDRHSAHFWTQDISFLAARVAGGTVAFQALIGGTQGQNPHLAWHLPVLVEPQQVVGVTQALLDLFREKGSREKRNAARFRFLIERIGVGGVLEWLEERLPFRLQPGVAEPSPASSHDELIGWFPQKQSARWIMGLSVPLGRLTWRQLEGLAVLSRKWGDGRLRTTHEQGIAVVDIAEGFKDAAATDAAALGLSVHADAFEQNTMACTGSQFCNIAVTETKGRMLQLIDKLRRKALKLHGIRMHMSGCPSSCAQHFTADIGLKGVRVRRLIGTREGSTSTWGAASPVGCTWDCPTNSGSTLTSCRRSLNWSCRSIICGTGRGRLSVLIGAKNCNAPRRRKSAMKTTAFPPGSATAATTSTPGKTHRCSARVVPACGETSLESKRTVILNKARTPSSLRKTFPRAMTISSSQLESSGSPTAKDSPLRLPAWRSRCSASTGRFTSSTTCVPTKADRWLRER
ncbi:MAG: nitrite/sulfite reductase [Planctomycetaceae bacterium]